MLIVTTKTDVSENYQAISLQTGKEPLFGTVTIVE